MVWWCSTYGHNGLSIHERKRDDEALHIRRHILFTIAPRHRYCDFIVPVNLGVFKISITNSISSQSRSNFNQMSLKALPLSRAKPNHFSSTSREYSAGLTIRGHERQAREVHFTLQMGNEQAHRVHPPRVVSALLASYDKLCDFALQPSKSYTHSEEADDYASVRRRCRFMPARSRFPVLPKSRQ